MTFELWVYKKLKQIDFPAEQAYRAADPDRLIHRPTTP
jgi:hypothetical protein